MAGALSIVSDARAGQTPQEAILEIYTGQHKFTPTEYEAYLTVHSIDLCKSGDFCLPQN
uniref:Uncharacterized protein n=1 Tax=Tetranychus urticae TaxID=32264 RepID=A0A158P4T3_TETUR